MKNNWIPITLIITMCFTISCKAQNIVPIYNGPEQEPPLPHYYKDVDNNLDPLVGTWKWQEGNNSLTVEFKKVERAPFGGESVKDILIGGYTYIKNGVECTNSLPMPNLPMDKLTNYPIWGGVIGTPIKGSPPCPECGTNPRYVKVQVREPENPLLEGKFIMGHFIQNGVEKMGLLFLNTAISMPTADYTGPEEMCIPEFSTLTLVKQ
ncbi:DUF6705 family protein [Croceitalea marina]|uniref:DUF6705 family protein n=1 Tax=Croceitalea marina TaxID=1775166 RepID=A0ABW5MU15_9FLAO